jgi:hypothetical protein
MKVACDRDQTCGRRRRSAHSEQAGSTSMRLVLQADIDGAAPEPTIRNPMPDLRERRGNAQRAAETMSSFSIMEQMSKHMQPAGSVALGLGWLIRSAPAPQWKLPLVYSSHSRPRQSGGPSAQVGGGDGKDSRGWTVRGRTKHVRWRSWGDS